MNLFAAIAYFILPITLFSNQGKDTPIAIALGITTSGEKIPMGFIQTTTENSHVVKGLLKDLLKRISSTQKEY